MSVDFTFSQAGLPQPLFELMVDIEREMGKAGFKKKAKNMLSQGKNLASQKTI